MGTGNEEIQIIGQLMEESKIMLSQCLDGEEKIANMKSFPKIHRKEVKLRPVLNYRMKFNGRLGKQGYEDRRSSNGSSEKQESG